MKRRLFRGYLIHTLQETVCEQSQEHLEQKVSVPREATFPITDLSNTSYATPFILAKSDGQKKVEPHQDEITQTRILLLKKASTNH